MQTGSQWTKYSILLVIKKKNTKQQKTKTAQIKIKIKIGRSSGYNREDGRTLSTTTTTEPDHHVSGSTANPPPKGMEGMVKKYQQKFRKVKDEMSRWDEFQSRLLSQFRNASSIIERLQLIQNPKNYGALKCVGSIEDTVLRKQMESLENILLSMDKTMKEFHSIVLFLEKTLHDGRQLVKGGSVQATPKQLQQQIGIKPCLADCLDGLSHIYEMHQSECLLKSSIVSALPAIALKPSGSDLGALQQLLVDQPNIPREEVQLIYDIVFAEEIC